jgi:methionine-rich copper-binding protein CopC
MARPLGPRAARLILPLLTVPMLCVAAAPASAHAILTASQPAIGGDVPSGPVALELTYNSRIDRGRSRLTLTRPDHTQAVLPIAADGPENVIRAKTDLTPGAYSLRWQVLAVDGHITRGDVPFKVTGH